MYFRDCVVAFCSDLKVRRAGFCSKPWDSVREADT